MTRILLTAAAVALAATQANATEFSAKKRYPQTTHAPYRASGPADPSFDRYGRPYRPTVQGPCMIDLGYGRFARCDGSL